jgi:hypothetical protein
MRTYILERTLDFFARRPDEPCPGAARLEPANSGVAPPRSAASTTAMCSPSRSRADPPASATVGVGPGPSQRRGKHERLGLQCPDK